MKLTIRGAQKKLTTLWSTIGREDAECEVCLTLPMSERYSYTKLDSHHLIGKKNKALKWNLRNRVWLCFSHHTGSNLSAHNDSKWFLDWFAENRPEDWEYILVEKNKIYKRTLDDYLDLIKSLEK